MPSYPNYPYRPNNQKKNTTGLVLGIVSIVVSSLGGMMLGVLMALVGAGLGIAGIVISINAKKMTNNQVGQAGFVCSIVGISLGVFFMIGCSCLANSNYFYSPFCYGCIGAALSGIY